MFAIRIIAQQLSPLMSCLMATILFRNCLSTSFSQHSLVTDCFAAQSETFGSLDLKHNFEVNSKEGRAQQKRSRFVPTCPGLNLSAGQISHWNTFYREPAILK